MAQPRLLAMVDDPETPTSDIVAELRLLLHNPERVGDREFSDYFGPEDIVRQLAASPESSGKMQRLAAAVRIIAEGVSSATFRTDLPFGRELLRIASLLDPHYARDFAEHQLAGKVSAEAYKTILSVIEVSPVPLGASFWRHQVSTTLHPRIAIHSFARVHGWLALAHLLSQPQLLDEFSDVDLLALVDEIVARHGVRPPDASAPVRDLLPKRPALLPQLADLLGETTLRRVFQEGNELLDALRQEYCNGETSTPDEALTWTLPGGHE